MTDVDHGVMISGKYETNLSGTPSIEIRCTCPWPLLKCIGHNREASG